MFVIITLMLSHGVSANEVSVSEFGLADVSSVTLHQGIPDESAVDGGYHRYVIVLKNGITREALVGNGPMTRMMFEDVFRGIGYTGDVMVLTEMAVEKSDPTPTSPKLFPNESGIDTDTPNPDQEETVLTPESSGMPVENTQLTILTRIVELLEQLLTKRWFW
jgi:hypothetical protein